MSLHDRNDSESAVRATRRAHSCRTHPGTGHALLSGLRAVPDPDGLGADSGRRALSDAPVPRGQDRRQARACSDDRGSPRRHPDHRANRRADEFAGRLGASIDHRRAGGHAPDPSPARRCRHVAPGRREALCDLVGGVHRPACSDQEHAAEDRRPRKDGARLRRQYRRRAAPIPRRLHHRRHHHGLWSDGQPCKPCHLRARRRRRAGRRVHEARPRRPYGPLPKASSASPSFRRSSSAFVCSLPVCRGRACWR